MGCRELRSRRALRRVQGAAARAPGPAEGAVAGDGGPRGGIRLSQRDGARLRGRRRDRLAGGARADGGAAGAGDDRDRRPRRLPADRRGGPGAGDGDHARDHGHQDLRPPGGDRSLRDRAGADPGLLRPEGRHLGQHPGSARDRREDGERADHALRLARGGARPHRRRQRREAQAEPDRAQQRTRGSPSSSRRCAGTWRSTWTCAPRSPASPT